MWKDITDYDKVFYHLQFEVSNKCNSRCLNCPRFIQGTPVVKPTVHLSEITIQQFKEWITPKILNKTNSILFCGTHGDPITCGDLVEIVRYIRETNPKIAIEIRTNGGVGTEDFWKSLGELINDKSRVIFSIDGLEDTNHLYRRNVKWDKLVNNIKTFTSSSGKGEWEYLVFKHNEHQISEANKLCEELGLDKLQLKRPIGFEDSDNNQTISMAAYNKEGILDYVIEPSSDYMNSSLPYNKDYVHPNSVHIFNDCFIEQKPTDFSGFLDIENNEIDCKSKMENSREVYINSHGDVRPCCFMANELDVRVYDNITNQVRNILSPKDKFNLKTTSLEIILEYFDDAFASKWDKSYGDGKCIKCAITCGKIGQQDGRRLFVK